MADSKYAHENGHQSNSTTLAGHTRTHYSNPNASLPPNSTMQTLRSHMMHKAPTLQHSSQISAITPGGVSREKNRIRFFSHKNVLLFSVRYPAFIIPRMSITKSQL